VQPGIWIQDENRVGPGGLEHAPVDPPCISDVGRSHDATIPSGFEQLDGRIGRPVVHDDHICREPTEGSRQRIEKIADHGRAVMGDYDHIDVGTHNAILVLQLVMFVRLGNFLRVRDMMTAEDEPGTVL
jgi:hypothetical protein